MASTSSIPSGDRARFERVWATVGAVAVVGLVVTIIGGYVFHWTWTGFGDNNTLWDWLELVLVPSTLGAVAVWMGPRIEAPRWWRGAVVVAGVAFGVLVVGGYRFHWRWTGFPGNKVWDWLHLLVLPAVLSVLPTWLATRRTHARLWRIIEAVLLIALLVLVLGGYWGHWGWTGFEDNKLWDWLQLLLVPFALPAVALALRMRREAIERRARVAALAAEATGPDGVLPPPRVGAITLAVADRDRAQRFYDELGFATVTHRGEGMVVYPGNGLGLALLEQSEVLARHGAPVGPGSGGFALVHPVADRVLLDDLVARAARAGATVVRPPQTAGTTVRAGFTDPDGHRWTVTAPS